MIKTQVNLDALDAQQLRELAQQLITTVSQKSQHIAKLNQEIAYLRRIRYGRRSEQLHGEQGLLFEESIQEDLGAIEQALSALVPKTPAPKTEAKQPKRQPLPRELPRVEFRYEPASTACTCGCQLKRIREDVSEKLDYEPGTFSVQRHVRGVWACPRCEQMTQEPMPAHVIDKGLPATGLLAQILISKFVDHMPLYRQENAFQRSGVLVPRSTMAHWVGRCGLELQPLVDALRDCLLKRDILHADETPVRTLDPGSGKTHRSYLWAYATGKFDPLKAVVYDFQDNRQGKNAARFLEGWHGKLLVDDYSGYKQVFTQGITEIGCMAHARRKFYDQFKDNKSTVAEQALKMIGELYAIERDTLTLDAHARQQARQERAKPLLDKLHEWMLAQRLRVLDGTGIAKALDYSLKRWAALVRYVDDGWLAIDNNHLEQQIRPVAVGRANWLFMGSVRAGQRAAAIMSLVNSAKLNGLNPHAYLRDVLERLPTHPANRIEDLLPHNWAASQVDTIDLVSEKICA